MLLGGPCLMPGGSVGRSPPGRLTPKAIRQAACTFEVQVGGPLLSSQRLHYNTLARKRQAGLGGQGFALKSLGLGLAKEQ